ncbi:disulfide bond formation protein B [Methylocapsa polymorpha]|uniref:Disulfide bond formation protein B n=1 Tax=Methylocapsa polymorpha TaxID=3080828 RepID=A0ABZ0HUL7_9HYPH|nr:disulfide bond formation protein B [Methylocapsa sp. RX1]
MLAQTSFRIAFAILLIASGSIVSAWVFEALGYAPCELCLKERIPYYVGVPLSGLALFLAAREQTRLLLAAFAGLALIFTASACFGAYHAGVEWGFWPGPTDCTGPLDHARSVEDFLTQLQRVKVVRCDAVAIRILGLSLAGWNAVISAGLASLALMGAWTALRHSRC